MNNIATDLQTLNTLLYKNFTDDVDLRQSCLSAVYVLKEMVSFMRKAVSTSNLGLHNYKVIALNEICAASEKLEVLLGSLAESKDKSQIPTAQAAFMLIRKQFNNYADYGSVYLFRHCDKSKVDKWWNPFKHNEQMEKLKAARAIDPKAKSEMYEGIPGPKIKEQAIATAKQIINQIALSTKPVKLYIYTSEMDRTKLFSEIVLREIRKVEDLLKNKVTFAANEVNANIRFDQWSKTALDERMPIYGDKTKGEYYTFFNWYHSTNEFSPQTTLFKNQPNPETVKANLRQFFSDGVDKVVADKHNHIIVLGFTHSFVIDTFIVDKGFKDIGKVIATAGFVKWECGQYYYNNEWRN